MLGFIWLIGTSVQGFNDRLHQYCSIGVRDQQSVDEAILGAEDLNDVLAYNLVNWHNLAAVWYCPMP